MEQGAQLYGHNTVKAAARHGGIQTRRDFSGDALSPGRRAGSRGPGEEHRPTSMTSTPELVTFWYINSSISLPFRQKSTPRHHHPVDLRCCLISAYPCILFHNGRHFLDPRTAFRRHLCAAYGARHHGRRCRSKPRGANADAAILLQSDRPQRYSLPQCFQRRPPAK